MNNKLNDIINLINKNALETAETKVVNLLNAEGETDTVYNILGIIYQKKNNYEKAITSFEKAINLNEKNVSAFTNLAVSFNSLGDEEKAMEYMRKALIINPELFAVHNNIGFILNKQKKYKDAIPYFQKAIKINSNYSQAYFNLGNSYNELEQTEKAIDNYNKAIEIKVDFEEAIFNLAEIYRKKNNYGKAINFYRKTNSSKSNVRILECLYVLGRVDEYQEKILSFKKNDPLDRRIAAISAYASDQLNIKNEYSFCPNPLNYIYKTNVKKHTPDLEDFIKKLLSELDDLDFKWQPAGKTTVKGYGTTGNLSKIGLSEYKKFETILEKEIVEYQNLFKNNSCNFITNWPKKHSFVSWSNRLKSEGHNIPHIHPSGWLSGVFYLKIPKKIKDNEAGIEFSLHGDNYYIINDKIPNKSFQPSVGDVLFFPSSLYHKTIPFKSNEERVCIAFDLVDSPSV